MPVEKWIKRDPVDDNLIYRVIVHRVVGDKLDASLIGWLRNGEELRVMIDREFLKKHNFEGGAIQE